MNINKIALQDAIEYARAQAFFGEGAGIRRRLIEHKIAGNSARFGERYQDAFDKALGLQDWADHAAKAVRERKRLDRGKFIKRNVGGVIRGNTKNLTTGVAVAVIAWGVAKETGLDKEIKVEVKAIQGRIKTEYLVLKAKIQHKRNMKSV